MTVAGASVVCASGAWFVGDDLVQRVLATGAAAAAVTGSVLLRTWDRTAGKSVAELKKARVRDEWKTDERIAELETDLEESREIRGRLDTKLRSKRAELARLRSEHAELLRRYATAETERASALEGRRLLAIEAGGPAGELTSGASADPSEAAPGALTTVMYHRAAEALRHLPRNAARQAERAQDQDGEDGQGNPVAATEPAADQVPARQAAAQETAGETAGESARETSGEKTARDTVPAPREPARTAEDRTAEDRTAEDRTAENRTVRGRDAVEGRDAAEATAPVAHGLRPVPAAAAVVAPVAGRSVPASRAQGGFDFFGTATGTGAVAGAAPAAGGPSTVTRRPKPVRQLEEDLADVVGDEAVAEQSARGQARTTDDAKPAAEREPGAAAEAAGETASGTASKAADSTDGAAEDGEAASGEVIDLTAHDETEQIDMAELRSAVSS
ncbi:hypothetical protein ACH4OW_23460 [Streptomyces sp. NPDC017056]|uniref:hypothetical protein n=1 Tax=Streptomyces sp. NPDC017056 TaxID=3364973 RepID=UPI0037B18735